MFPEITKRCGKCGGALEFTCKTYPVNVCGCIKPPSRSLEINWAVQWPGFVSGILIGVVLGMLTLAIAVRTQ